MSASRERIALNLQAVKEQSLKSVSIGLAISDDLKGATEKMNAANAQLVKAIATYKAQYMALRQEMATAEGVRNAQEKVITMAEAKAKELGVLPKSVGGFAEAEKAFLLIDTTLDKADPQ